MGNLSCAYWHFCAFFREISIQISCLLYNGSFVILDKRSHTVETTIYSWSFNNMGLNYTGPLIHRIFSVNTMTILHDLLLVESTDAETQTQRAEYEVICTFHCSRVNSTSRKGLIFILCKKFLPTKANTSIKNCN